MNDNRVAGPETFTPRKDDPFVATLGLLKDFHFHRCDFPCNLWRRSVLLVCGTRKAPQWLPCRIDTTAETIRPNPKRGQSNDKQQTECIASDGGALRTDRWNLRSGPGGHTWFQRRRVKAAKAGFRLTSADKPPKHSCKGKNDCKGQGGCKSSDNGCKAKNSCKGKGGCATDGSKMPKFA